MKGKKCAKQFSQKHTNDSKKNVGKKIVAKNEKKVFYFHTNIVTKNGEKQSAKQFFQKHTNGSGKNVEKIIDAKKREKTFFIFTRIS